MYACKLLKLLNIETHDVQYGWSENINVKEVHQQGLAGTGKMEQPCQKPSWLTRRAVKDVKLKGDNRYLGRC